MSPPRKHCWKVCVCVLCGNLQHDYQKTPISQKDDVVFKEISEIQMEVERIWEKRQWEGLRGHIWGEEIDGKGQWETWEKVLSSKKPEGFGVSSFFATNRALLFKWVRSPWIDIVRELYALSHQGIDLLLFVRNKVINGEDTLFWAEIWLDKVALKLHYPRLYALESHKQISVAAKIGHASLDFSYPRSPRDADANADADADADTDADADADANADADVDADADANTDAKYRCQFEYRCQCEY
ncbi:hypothetical protein Tco_0994142 [Tanacetum coccineum]